MPFSPAPVPAPHRKAGGGGVRGSGGGKPGPWLPGGGGSITPDDKSNGTATVFYNQLATLLFSTGGLRDVWLPG